MHGAIGWMEHTEELPLYDGMGKNGRSEGIQSDRMGREEGPNMIVG